MHLPVALVVDDDLVIRETISEVLLQEGFAVQLAENGEVGLSFMRSERAPDVVILDLMMPVLSGWEVLEEVLADQKLKQIPIVVVSAMATSLGDPNEHGGVRACVSKPFDLRLLVDTVKSSADLERTVEPPPVERVRKPLRVLLVEDSADDAELIALELRSAGFDAELRSVATASAFRAALASEDWDVVLSDFALPAFSGKEALDILKGSGMTVPFILVSGTLGEAVAVEVMRAGAQDYCAKGSLGRLGAAIEREVREARRKREQQFARARAEAERDELLSSLHAAVKARDDFIAVAAHELRTPLTALQLQAQMLLRMVLEPPNTKPACDSFGGKVNVINRQVTRMTTLVESLLDVNRATSGHMQLVCEPVALKRTARVVIDRLDDFVRQSGSDVELVGDEVTGHWDPSRVETIIANLLSNALKFGSHKPIELRTSRTGSVAELVVTDHGIGISDEEQQRVFQKFERAVPQRHYGGLGLGLWITQQLVAAHRGTIRVVSEKGIGSAFIVTLPLGMPAAGGGTGAEDR